MTTRTTQSLAFLSAVVAVLFVIMVALENVAHMDDGGWKIASMAGFTFICLGCAAGSWVLDHRD